MPPQSHHRLLPIGAALLLARHRTLRVLEAPGLLRRGLERRDQLAVARRGERSEAQIDPERGRHAQRIDSLMALDLDRCEPLACLAAHADVAHLAGHGPALPHARPAQLRELDAPVRLIQLDLLCVREAQTRLVTVLLEGRQAALLGEEALVRSVQTLQRLLLCVHRSLGQPRTGGGVAPRGEPLGHVDAGGVLLASRVPCAARPARGSRPVRPSPRSAAATARPQAAGPARSWKR